VASAVFNASEQVGASVGVALLNTHCGHQYAAYVAVRPLGQPVSLAGWSTATPWPPHHMGRSHPGRRSGSGAAPRQRPAGRTATNRDGFIEVRRVDLPDDDWLDIVP
jgi:hypothetical protein